MVNLNKAVNSIPQMKRGRLWCTKCPFECRVNAVEAMAWGWPSHCGETMTIDSPEERAAVLAVLDRSAK